MSHPQQLLLNSSPFCFDVDFVGVVFRWAHWNRVLLPLETVRTMCLPISRPSFSAHPIEPSLVKPQGGCYVWGPISSGLLPTFSHARAYSERDVPQMMKQMKSCRRLFTALLTESFARKRIECNLSSSNQRFVFCSYSAYARTPCKRTVPRYSTSLIVFETRPLSLLVFRRILFMYLISVWITLSVSAMVQGKMARRCRNSDLCQNLAPFFQR